MLDAPIGRTQMPREIDERKKSESVINKKSKQTNKHVSNKKWQRFILKTKDLTWVTDIPMCQN